MVDQRKLDAINSLKVLEDDGDGDVCFYVWVDDTPENRQVLLDAGFTENGLTEVVELFDDGNTLDVSRLAWPSGATYWTGKKFVVEREAKTE